jgi:hypothetical protein
MIQAEQATLASATGIFYCLRQLAEEAATLNLPHTLAVAANETEYQPVLSLKH